MKSWRTTVSAIVTAAFGFVVFSPELFQHLPWLIAISKYFFAGGLVSMGLSSKDAAVHSTVDQVQVATIEKDTKIIESLNAEKNAEKDLK